MILVGFGLERGDRFVWCEQEEEVSRTPPGSVILLGRGALNRLLAAVRGLHLPFGVVCQNPIQLAEAHQMGASVLVVETGLARAAQEFVDRYVLDLKVFVCATTEAEKEWALFCGVDGVIDRDSLPAGRLT